MHSGGGHVTLGMAAHGDSQMELASFLGVHHSTISRILAVNKAQI